MSSYKNFSRCVICRSYENLKMYERLGGEYEVTMLLNTLYLTVMYPIEHRMNLHVKAKKVSGFLRKYAQIDECGNRFSDDDLVRYLRNGLAHFNIKVTPENANGEIEEIMISAKNLMPKVQCDTPCANPKCTLKQLLQEKNDGVICIFQFRADKLRNFTEELICFLLETFPKNACKMDGCKLFKEQEEQNVQTNI